MTARDLRIRFVVEVDETNDARAHLYAHGREHDTDTVRCWCKPTINAICDCDDGCWKCDALTECPQLTPDEAEAPDAPKHLVIHRMR